ncbi:MAG: carboxypeptidase regulatory-like domain-containing protein [Pyrinomonadaceae bacterium]
MKFTILFILSGFFALFFNVSIFAQQNGSLGGQVVDSLGAVVVGASITVVSASGAEKTTTSNQRGEFSVASLAPGKYTVKVSAPKFSLYENTDVDIAMGKRGELIVTMTVGGVEEQVEIASDAGVSTDPANNAGATVLKEKDLEALPDDPAELEAALQALAGASAGPDGGQIMIDGFTGGRMPPKEAIREVRINSNPFSAEYDRVGFGRIEILTKPGFSKWRGSANLNFNDESLNSRNPFAPNRAPSQLRNYGGFVSGPIQSKKSSLFVDFNRSERDENSVVTATLLDPTLNIIDFNQDITVPTRRTSFSPRFDYAINDKNFLMARYSFSQSTSENQGIGGFSLATRATNSESTQHSIQLTESAIITPTTVNETRFQYDFNKRDQTGDNSIPSINVSSAFTGGGSQIGRNFNESTRWELQNYTTTSVGKASQHAVKFGIRIRGVTIEDQSESGYGGAFTFSGFLNNNGTPNNPDDDFFVSSINQFREKVLGNPDPRYNPNQFSLTTGNPLADVSQIDYSPFITDDWKVRQDLTLSFGLRYENQSNISDNFNLAPRVGFAWAPGSGGARQPKTVFRGGFGVFFDRFSENNTLRAIRNDGVSQLQYIVTNNQSNILGQAVFSNIGVTNVPTAAQLGTLVPLSSTPFRISDELSSPYSMQSAISVERQLPYKTVFSATFSLSRSENTLRTRNINAPVCPAIQACPANFTSAQVQALRPNPASGNIYQIESSGFANSKLLNLSLRSNLTTRISINGGYTLSFADGDTDSLSSPRFTVNSVGYPAYSYDLRNEFGPSAFNARHSVFFVGSIGLPWGFRANSIMTFSSGRRFNITSGVDTNRDSLFFDRPTFTALSTRCEELGLDTPYCDVSGISDPDNTLIPRNYGKGPGSFVVNLNLSKTFGFGGPKATAAAAAGQGTQTAGDGQGARGGRGGQRGGGVGGQRGGRAGGGGGGGGMMGGPGGFGGGEAPKPYNLTFGINVQNLLNTVNLSSPVGSLTSTSFGTSRSTGGGFGFFGGGGGGGSANRRVDLSVRFSW